MVCPPAACVRTLIPATASAGMWWAPISELVTIGRKNVGISPISQMTSALL